MTQLQSTSRVFFTRPATPPASAYLKRSLPTKDVREEVVRMMTEFDSANVPVIRRFTEEMFAELVRLVAVADEKALADLAYGGFLSTVYWVTVREYLLLVRGRRCQVCGTTDGLNVHHVTYEHRGSEHRHLDDLTVLCRSCHSLFHGSR